MSDNILNALNVLRFVEEEKQMGSQGTRIERDKVFQSYGWRTSGQPLLFMLGSKFSVSRSSSRKRKGLRVKVIFKQARQETVYLHNDELLAESELLFDRTIISVKQKHWISYMLKFKDVCRRSVSNAFIWPKTKHWWHKLRYQPRKEKYQAVN